MDEKEAEARPLMGTIFLVYKEVTESSYCQLRITIYITPPTNVYVELLNPISHTYSSWQSIMFKINSISRTTWVVVIFFLSLPPSPTCACVLKTMRKLAGYVKWMLIIRVE